MLGLHRLIILVFGVTAARTSSRSGSHPSSSRSTISLDGDAERLCPSPDLQVVRHEQHQFVAGLQKGHYQNEVRFRRTIGDHDVVTVAAGVQAGNGITQLDAAIGPAITQLHLMQAKQLIGRQQFLQ